MENKSKERCYFCTKPATSREHIPPKQMFKGFDCDSITVPSCDNHNSKKCGHDQAIVSALLIPLHTGRNRYPLEPEIIQAIELALPSFERSKHFAVQSPFLKDPPKGLEDLPDLAHLEPSVKVADWVRQLTAGLVYSKIELSSTTISWSKATTWSPDWFPTYGPGPIAHREAVEGIKVKQKQRAILDKLSWEQGWSAYPRPYPSIIYTFHFHVFPDKYVVFRHKFYNRYTWYVTFKASKKCIAKLTMGL
jgi:hypothetical protein